MSLPILSSLSAEAIARYHAEGHWQDDTIYGIARKHAETIPDVIALRDRHIALTYEALIVEADLLAARLHAAGTRPGERVAFWMPDRIEAALIVLACSRNGYVVCPSPHRNHTVAELIDLLARMRAAVLIHQAGFGSDAASTDVAAAIAKGTNVRQYLTIKPPTDPRVLFDGAAFPDADRAALPDPIRDPDRVSYLAFTSGSTGNPKGVMHSDNTQLVTARNISRDWNINSDSVVYSMSPFSHNLGMGSFLTTLVGGGEYVIHDRARDESIVERLLEIEATYLVGVPTHAIDILEQAKQRGLKKLGKVTGFRISGAAAPKPVFEELIKLGVTPQSGYGMTENNAHQYTRPEDAPDLIIGTCGRACDGYEIRIFDPDDSVTELPAGETGLVAGKGACLMLGYYNDQIATETAFNHDGWFLTGDLGWIDKAGYLRLTGRRKEVIIRGGHNINPEKIEELAMRHPDVERAAAIPVPDDRLGERACIAVMMRNGAEADFTAILQHLAERGLSRYDMPEFGLAIAEIPLMANGKIEKKPIQAAVAEGALTPRPIGGGN